MEIDYNGFLLTWNPDRWEDEAWFSDSVARSAKANVPTPRGGRAPDENTATLKEIACSSSTQARRGSARDRRQWMDR